MMQFLAEHIRITANGIGLSWAAACIGLLAAIVFVNIKKWNKGEKNG